MGLLSHDDVVVLPHEHEDRLDGRRLLIVALVYLTDSVSVAGSCNRLGAR